MKVDYGFETKYGPFLDAIVFDDNAPMTDEEIEAEKHRRLSSWIALMDEYTNREA
jgi:hypothetical protein